MSTTFNLLCFVQLLMRATFSNKIHVTFCETCTAVFFPCARHFLVLRWIKQKVNQLYKDTNQIQTINQVDPIKYEERFIQMLSRGAYSKLNSWPLQNATSITSLNSLNSFMWRTGNTISLAHARTTGKHNLCNGFFVKQSWLNLTDILKLPIRKGLWLCPVTHFKKPAGLILASDSLAEVSSSVSHAKDSAAPKFFHLPSLLENPVNGQASSSQPTSQSYLPLRK